MELLQDELKVANPLVEVVAGGSRGMRVTVTLSKSQQSSVAELERALSAFLFEAKVQVA